VTDDANELTKLTAVPDEAQAALVVHALADHGIEAQATGDYTSGFRAEAPGSVQVVVKQADLARAKQALALVKRQDAQIDWSQVDVGDAEEEEDV